MYIGRADRRFKHNGKRINPAEIEQQLKQYCSVDQAIVTKENSRLTAYLISTKDTTNKAEEIKQALSLTLPEHLIPDDFIFLNEYPLTERGKVDYQALSQSKKIENAYQALTTSSDTCSLLLALWRQVLEAPLATVNDDFFALGGDSIAALRIAALARKKNIRFNPAQLVKYSTVEQLASVCSAQYDNKKLIR